MTLAEVASGKTLGHWARVFREDESRKGEDAERKRRRKEKERRMPRVTSLRSRVYGVGRRDVRSTGACSMARVFACWSVKSHKTLVRHRLYRHRTWFWKLWMVKWKALLSSYSYCQFPTRFSRYQRTSKLESNLRIWRVFQFSFLVRNTTYWEFF